MSNNETNPNESAFAKAAFYHPEGGIDSPQSGLTKREYFAAKALQGILSDHTRSLGKDIAIDAVKMADHLIKALNNDQQ